MEIQEKINSLNLKSKLGLVIDFGLIITNKTIHKFSLGIINSHFSLLPRWRGADPITYTILHGDKEAGVTLMKIVPELDEGPILAQEKISLDSTVTASELTNRLIKLSNSMLERLLPTYIDGSLKLRNQPSKGITYSHKINKQEGKIDWFKSAKIIEREIRAYSIWPRSRTILGNVEVIVNKAQVVDKEDEPGKYIFDDNKNLIVYCGQQALSILHLQPIGKKNMTISEFIRGYNSKLDLG